MLKHSSSKNYLKIETKKLTPINFPDETGIPSYFLNQIPALTFHHPVFYSWNFDTKQLNNTTSVYVLLHCFSE